MKQHITVEQAKENPYIFKKIAIRLGYSIDVYDGIIKGSNLEEIVKQINIGQMIEILEESSQKFEIKKIFDSITERFEYWNIYISYIGIDDMKEIDINGYKLINILFEALKEVL